MNSESESETLYRAVAWWNTQRGSERSFAVDNPEAALAEAERRLESGEWDIDDNHEFDDSDGPTNLEIWEVTEERDGEIYHPLSPVLEDLSEDERLNRAAPALLTFVETYLGTQPGPGFKKWMHPDTLATMAREAAAEATGDSTGGAAAPTSDLRAAPATERGEG